MPEKQIVATLRVVPAQADDPQAVDPADRIDRVVDKGGREAPGPGGPPIGPDGPGGRPGGRPGGPRGGPQQQRREVGSKNGADVSKKELQPQELATYTPADAPVPEGEVVIERGSTAQEASKLNRSAADVVRFLLQQGEMVTATQSLSDDMVDLFAAELGAEVRLVDPGAEQEEEILKVLEIDLDTHWNCADHRLSQLWVTWTTAKPCC